MVTLKKFFAGSKKEEDHSAAPGMVGSSLAPPPQQERPGAVAGPVARRASPTPIPAFNDSPEVNVRNAIKGFCESGGNTGPTSVGRNLSFQFTISYRKEPKFPSSSMAQRRTQGEEVLFLPTIVDSAESSPTAAKEAAHTIRKYLDMKYASEPQLQYNAIMLMRILADNPGRTFTRNLDQKFADKVKELLKHGRDPGVRQILMETLDHFDISKKDDEGLNLLRIIWQKQKMIMSRYQQAYPNLGYTRPSARAPKTSLPPLEELVGRISEAQMSAKLLHQVLSSTPRNEILDNELVKEFVHRCRSASTSMADFITCDSPPPDPDTMSTLIETNDILRIALARFEAMKGSIEMTTAGSQPAPPSTAPASTAPAVPAPLDPPVNPASRNDGPPDLDNPFSDPQPLAPLSYPGGTPPGGTSMAGAAGARMGHSRSPAGRLPKIDTGVGKNQSPVSPVTPPDRGNYRY